jgi:hypothetical protein
MRGPYDDIIDLSHPVSQKHPQMSMHDRAAQFSPFAALTGHGAAIAETERETAAWTELEEDEREQLNRQLCTLRECLGEQMEVAITYFVPDSRKAGGAYVTIHGIVRKMDMTERYIQMMDRSKVPIDQIRSIAFAEEEPQT